MHPQQAVFARGEAVSRPDLVGLPQTKPPPSLRVFLSRCCCPYVPECCLVACCVPAVAGMNSRLLSAHPAAASLYPPCHPRPRVPHMCLVSVCPMPALLSCALSVPWGWMPPHTPLSLHVSLSLGLSFLSLSFWLCPSLCLFLGLCFVLRSRFLALSLGLLLFVSAHLSCYFWFSLSRCAAFSLPLFLVCPSIAPLCPFASVSCSLVAFLPSFLPLPVRMPVRVVC